MQRRLSSKQWSALKHLVDLGKTSAKYYDIGNPEKAARYADEALAIIEAVLRGDQDQHHEGPGEAVEGGLGHKRVQPR